MDEQNKNSNKILMIVGGLIIVAVVVGLIYVFAFGNNEDEDVTEEDTTEMVEEEDDTYSVESGTMSASATIYDNLAGVPEFSTAVAAIDAAGLESTLQADEQLTLFVPTNTAFEALPEGTLDTLLLPENIAQLTNILTNHVVAGTIESDELTDGGRVVSLAGEDLVVYLENGPTVNGANITDVDLEQSNGVIHVIDEVLLPPSASTEVGGVEIPRTNTIAESATAAADLSTLVQAAQAAGLVETLAGEGTYTVFAPLNSAFAALPAGTLDTLLLPENVQQLQGVLTYHVLGETLGTNQLYDGQELVTLSGATLTVQKVDGITQLVNSDGTVVANVVVPNIYQSNGVVHVIDSVLLPPSPEANQ